MMSVATPVSRSSHATPQATPSPVVTSALQGAAQAAATASTRQRAYTAPPTPAVYQRMEWVFAYGSLIWNPEFDFDERHKVRIEGYHRAFCINSHTYRGTPDAPGVVLGLDCGGSCEGIVYRVRRGQEADIMDRIIYL